MRTRHPYAARLNSFATLPGSSGAGGGDRLTTLELIDRAATVPGLSAVDVNFPQQTQGIDLAALRTRIADRGLRLNGLAMRYNDIPKFRRGAFTNPDAAVRQQAIDLTRRGIDATLEAGGTMLTIWPGQDGFDHPFHVDYARMFDHEVEGLRAVAEHAPDVPVSIEYKPNDPRSVMVLPNVCATLLAIAEAGAPNLGVTIDFGHSLEADVSPAMAAAMVGRRSRLLGLHINDGYGRRDDGLMPGSVNTVRTIELLRQLRLQSFHGVIYFDTFPDVAHLDPVAEATASVATMELLWDALDRIAESELAVALEQHDAVAAQRLVQRAILGRDG